MLDVNKLFEDYLPRWSNEKHLPIPTKKHMDRWYQAWQDFVKEELPKYYSQMCEQYKNIELKNAEDTVLEDDSMEDEFIEPTITIEDSISQKQLTPWEKVQARLKESE